jgi:hypothetical protein
VESVSRCKRDRLEMTPGFYTYREGRRGSGKGPTAAAINGRLSYQSSYGFASGQIPRRSQGTLLPSSGEPKVSNPWNNVQHRDSI